MITKDLIYGLRGTCMSIIYFLNIISTLLNKWVHYGHTLVKGIRLMGHSSISKLGRHRTTFIFLSEHLDLIGKSEISQIILTDHVKICRLSKASIDLTSAGREVSLLLSELTRRAIRDLLDIYEGFIERWG